MPPPPGGARDHERAHDRLTRTRAEVEHPGITVESRVLEGDPARALVTEAGSGGHDLVVVGVKGCGATPFFELGSVARRMSRATLPSLLLVRKGGGGYARRLSSETQSSFRALLSTGEDGEGAEMRWGILGALALAETVAHTAGPGRPNAVRELDRLARQTEADLLILGDDISDGDTLRTTIWTAPCTVLVARPAVSSTRGFGVGPSRSTVRPPSDTTRPDPRRRSKREAHPS